jgi:hypothetical protein
MDGDRLGLRLSKINAAILFGAQELATRLESFRIRVARVVQSYRNATSGSTLAARLAGM